MGNFPHKGKEGTMNVEEKPEEREHIDSEDCWCQPEVIFVAEWSGNRVWVHKGNGEELAPAWVVAQAIADAIADRME